MKAPALLGLAATGDIGRDTPILPFVAPAQPEIRVASKAEARELEIEAQALARLASKCRQLERGGTTRRPPMTHGGSLNASDYSSLAESWITPEMAEQAGICRLDEQEARASLGINSNRSGSYAGVAFPYTRPGSTLVNELRIRRDDPDLELRPDGSKKERGKYMGPPGRGNRLYFVPETPEATLKDVSLPVIFTEGEKKALALALLAEHEAETPRFVPIGIPGVWGWRGTVGTDAGPNGERRNVKGPLPDFDLVEWEGRVVYILFDNDVHRNEKVRAARSALAQELRRRGTRVKLVDLPESDQKVGVDDYLASEGPAATLDLIANAADAGDEIELSRLASLSPIEYDRARADAAKRLGVRTSALDREVELRRREAGEHKDQASGTTVELPEPEPWPTEVHGPTLAQAMRETVRCYLYLSQEAAIALVLWALHSHAHEAARISPILAVTSPVFGCGKTTVLTLLGTLCPRVLTASNITAAALFRAVERWSPTLLVDEADTFLKGNDDLRGVINSGHNKAAAYVIRTAGDDHEPRRFRTWAPKAIALIGKLQPTLASRSIEIRMQRLAPGESVEELRGDRLDQFDPLCRQACRWVHDNLTALREADPAIPAGLGGRAADNWRPLLAIADAVGDEWPELAREAAVALTVSDDQQPANIQLLLDIHDVFNQLKTDRVSSMELATRLGDMEDRPWPEWRNGKPLTTRQLAAQLKPFGVGPRSIRTEDQTPKGYLLESFNDAFARYIPDRSATPPQAPVHRGLGENRSATEESGVADRKCVKPLQTGACGGVADRQGGSPTVKEVI